jgi:hypothetical protein
MSGSAPEPGTEPNLVKVFFEPPNDPNEDWHTKVESMCAVEIEEPAAPGGRVYQLDNSPWYVFGVSYKDQVCAELRREVFEEPAHAEYDVLYFTFVWRHLGHSTYALFLRGDRTKDDPEWKQYWERLERMGCSSERMNAKLIAVDVPPTANLDEVEQVFEEAEANDVFAYQTQHRFEASEN